jgi:hypothetical protein
MRSFFNLLKASWNNKLFACTGGVRISMSQNGQARRYAVIFQAVFGVAPIWQGRIMGYMFSGMD